jgi:hypothetical protein
MNIKDRIEYTIEIYELADMVFSSKNRIFSWFGSANSLFNGRSATEILAEGTEEDIEKLKGQLLGIIMGDFS